MIRTVIMTPTRAHEAAATRVFAERFAAKPRRIDDGAEHDFDDAGRCRRKYASIERRKPAEGEAGGDSDARTHGAIGESVDTLRSKRLLF